MKEKELLLLRLVELMLEKQQTFLLLDELYEDEIVGSYIRNIQIDSPYQQLLFEGVLSQFSQGEELVVSITVENYFHHLLGFILQKDDRYQSPESLIHLIKSNNLKGLKEGVSNLLSLDVEIGNFKRITSLIDLSEGDEVVFGICVMPLVNALLIHGVEKTIEVIFDNPSENDWEVLFELDVRLNILQLHLLRKDFLKELIPQNQYHTKKSLWLGLRSITLFDKDEALMYFSKIDKTSDFIQGDMDLSLQLGICENKFGNYDKAHEYYKKSLAIRLKTIGENHPIIAKSYNKIGLNLLFNGEIEKALKYFEKSLAIYLKTIGEDRTEVATSYNNIGQVWQFKGEYEMALLFYNKSLNIDLKILGTEDLSVAKLYDNIANSFEKQREDKKALDYYQKSIKIRLKILGEEHSEVASTYNNVGYLFCKNGMYDDALELFNKCLNIDIKTVGLDHPDVATSYNNIGTCWDSIGNYEKALDFYQKSLGIRLKKLGLDHPDVANSYHNIGGIYLKKAEYKNSLLLYQKSLKIRLNKLGAKHIYVAKSYYNVGISLIGINNFVRAIKCIQKAYIIEKNGRYPLKIAQCYEALNDKKNALDYFIQSAEIRKEDPEVGLEAEATQESISKAIRLAKELDKENELPNWMKKNN
jgi:tetratricopeptide (TPR) repeat protein